jgi:hypothetical protein
LFWHLFAMQDTSRVCGSEPSYQNILSLRLRVCVCGMHWASISMWMGIFVWLFLGPGHDCISSIRANVRIWTNSAVCSVLLLQFCHLLRVLVIIDG